MLRTTTALLTLVTTLASTGAFAQQDLLQASQLDEQTRPAVGVNHTDHAAATRLGKAVTAYNQTTTGGAIDPELTDADNVKDVRPTAETRELDYAIRAYNGRLHPAGDTGDYSHMPDRRALALANEVTRFNDTGGSLDVISNHNVSSIQ